MSLLLLDTHVLFWLSAEPDRLSPAANKAIDAATDLAVAGVTWYELAWLANAGRISIALPLRTWLTGLAEDVITLPLTPSIADTGVNLPNPFPNDPADRQIFATAVEHGIQLVSRDGKLRNFPYPREIIVW